MLLCIDDANVEAIRRLVEYYPIDGVSTNPTIISRTKREPFEVLKEIREIIGSERELFAQVLATEADGMLADAKRIIKELGDNTIVKIPCTTEGFKAMKMCHKEGIRLLGTAIYTPMQGFIAAKCGCEYLAPYVNRIDNTLFIKWRMLHSGGRPIIKFNIRVSDLTGTVLYEKIRIVR